MRLQVQILASSSAGNCFIVTDGTSSILLEAGISIKRIQQGTNFRLTDIAGALCSHSHADHSKAVRELMQAGIDVYMSAGCAGELGVSGYRAKTVKAMQRFRVGSFICIPFATVHDAAEPLGFVLKSTACGESLLFATDTHYIHNRFAGLNIIMIECNYTTERLMRSDTPPALKKRLLASHMSLETTLQFLANQDLTKCRAIYLTHLSRDRADAEEMRRKVARQTGKMVEVCARNYGG